MNFLVDNNIIILFVTETWLTDQNNNTTAQIKDHGYKIHHSHRSSRTGGGTAIIYKSTVHLTKVFISESPTFEAIAAKMKMSNNMTVLCSCIYRPPGPLGTFIRAIPRLREKNGKFEIRDWRPKFLLISLEILLSIWGKKIYINISKNVQVMCR